MRSYFIIFLALINEKSYNRRMILPAFKRDKWKELYRGLAGQLDWGNNTRLFLAGLLTLTPFMALSRLVAMSTHILAGRWMGPDQYGLVGLTIAASKIWLLFISLGFLTVAYRIAALAPEKRPAAISTIVLSLVFWLGISLSVLLAFHAPLARIFKVSPAVYFWSVLYASSQISYGVAGNMLLGLQKFKARGIIELCYALLVLSALGASFYLKPPLEFTALLRAMTLGCALGFFLCLYTLREFLKPVFYFPTFRDVLAYTGPYLMSWGSLVGAESLVSLMVSWNLTPRDLGYFSAYQTAVFRPVLVAATIVGAVLGPISSAPERQEGTWKKFFRHGLAIFLLAFPLFFLAGSAMVKLMGQKYPLNLFWMAFFAAAGSFLFLSAFPATILNSRDSKSAWKASFSAVFGSLLCAAVGFWAIPKWGIIGAALSLTFLYAGSFAWNCACGYLQLENN